MIFSRKNLFGIKVEGIKNIPWVLASHAFLIIIFFIFLYLLVGVYLFYTYGILVEGEAPKIVDNTIEFNYSAYEGVLRAWEAKDQSFQESVNGIYPNPFSSPLNSVVPENPKK